MQDDLTDSEIKNDNAYRPNTDQVEDDLERLIGYKQEFIELMKNVRRHIGAEAFDCGAVAVEQLFDDMLHDDFERLNASIDARRALPESFELHEYNTLIRRRALQTNPATHKAMGKPV